jgi:GT2 family glycosyltransferase
MVEVSVVVPTLKPREEIACVPVFERSEFTDYEIVVRSDSGASTARNAGIERASGDKLVFLDDDSYPCEGYLPEAARVLEEHAAVAGRIVHPFDDIFDEFTTYYDYGTEPQSVTRLVSCNMAIRPEVFEVAGTFDEDFDWGHEDTEFSYRVNKAFDIHYDPDLLVRHCYAESALELWRKHFKLGTHRMRYLEKMNIERPERVARELKRVFDPGSYVGASFDHTVLRTGATLATVLGMLSGMPDDGD